MPLSEEEQRVLDEIERQFDETARARPRAARGASTVARTRPGAWLGGVGLAAGVALIGFATPVHFLLGLVGYLVAVAAVVHLLDARRTRPRRAGLFSAYVMGARLAAERRARPGQDRRSTGRRPPTS
jgi:hypothetical protein